MKTRIKVTAAAALLAAFAGASADEARLDEVIVIGKRAPSALILEIERAQPKVTLETFVPTIEVPAIHTDLLRFLHDAD